MTTNTLMTMKRQRPPRQATRERLDSFEETPTGLLTLSPEFLDAVRQVAPKVRRRALPFVVLLAAAAGVAVASGRRVLLNRDPGARIYAPAPLTATADFAARSRVAPPPDTGATIAAESVRTAPPAAAATVSGDDPARAEHLKTTRVRNTKTPR